MISKLLVTLHTRLEETVGTITGGVVGYIAHRTFSDILITLSLALLTGFLGGAGAWIFKLTKAWILSRKK